MYICCSYADEVCQYNAIPICSCLPPVPLRSLITNYVYPTLQITSPPSPSLYASHPSLYSSVPFLPSFLSSATLKTSTSPNPKPETFFALFPLNIRPSSSLSTFILTLGLLTRFIRLSTGTPFRCFSPTHIRLAGGAREANSTGEGWVGVPKVRVDRKP